MKAQYLAVEAAVLIHLVRCFPHRGLDVLRQHSPSVYNPNSAVADLSERIYDAEPKVMERLQREWMIGRLTWMLYRKRGKIRPSNQLSLPGFENIPQRLKMPDGRFAALKNATVHELKRYRRFLSDRSERRIEQIDKLIALVVRHARKRKPPPTVSEVMQAEQVKLERK